MTDKEPLYLCPECGSEHVTTQHHHRHPTVELNAGNFILHCHFKRHFQNAEKHGVSHVPSLMLWAASMARANSSISASLLGSLYIS